LREVLIRNAIVAAALLGAFSPARADDAQSIIAKYIAWRGGSAFESMSSFHERGEARLGGLHGAYEQWLARDGRVRRNGTLGPISNSEATTATAGWTTNASGEVEELGDDGESDRRETLLAFGHAAEAYGARYTLLGSEQRDGRLWQVLRVEFKGPDTYDLFIAPDTGELLGQRITEDLRTRFLRYGDWRMVGGVRMPFEEQETGSNRADDQHRSFAAIQINVRTPPALFIRPKTPRIWSFSSGMHSTGWIDFEFFDDGEIFIPALINGRPVKLLLDSGAGITVLDTGFATALGIRPGGTLPVTGAGGEATMQLASNLKISLQSLSLGHITAGVIDLSAVAAEIGHPMPLILGKEVFNQLIIDIDFQQRKIAFRDPEDYASPADAIRVPLGRHGDHRTVPVSVQGADPVWFDFDLGNDSPLIVYSSYRDSTHLLDGKPQSLDFIGGVGGVAKVKIATLGAIGIAGVQLADIPADFPDAADNAVSSDMTAGNIGLPIFSRFRLATDYPHDALWLIPDAKALAEPFPKNRSGLILTHSADRLKTLFVAPGSPAGRGGWKEGAEIIAIDGQRIDATYSSSRLSHWAEQRTGTIVVLTLADGSTRELTLEDYY
jgi:hypothetical protein